MDTVVKRQIKLANQAAKKAQTELTKAINQILVLEQEIEKLKAQLAEQKLVAKPIRKRRKIKSTLEDTK